jgi:hypothetical protein
MNLFFDIIHHAFDLLLDSAVYVLFGILIGGLLKVFLNPSMIAHHLGNGRVSSVLKAALLGVPMPLCSCGVLPAAASLKRQGASNGATTAFLISTPESGVDSIAISYALLDPAMTIARPLAGVAAAVTAGVAENLSSKPGTDPAPSSPDLTCPVDSCCDGIDCPPDTHAKHHTWSQKLLSGLRYAFGQLWADLAGWFMVGLLLAGVITALVPPDFMTTYLGGGISSMLLMLVVGIPIYICATSSTPVAAALILQGVSPGAALVFLIAGPATNITSLTVVLKILGKRATAIYLGTIAVAAVLSGLALDAVYSGLNLSPKATIGTAAELVPDWAKLAGAVILLALSVKPLARQARALFHKKEALHNHDHGDICESNPNKPLSGCSGST